MLRLIVRGAFVGAALLGLVVIALGGASALLIATFWLLGASLCAVRCSRPRAPKSSDEGRWV